MAGPPSNAPPFFVMEYVAGLPITQHCDSDGLDSETASSCSSPSARPCSTPPPKGVIHRDLKPSNVLVASYDDKPVPKVIDFGIAETATLSRRPAAGAAPTLRSSSRRDSSAHPA